MTCPLSELFLNETDTGYQDALRKELVKSAENPDDDENAFRHDVVKFSCAPGYALSGTSTVECRDNGWNGTRPHCEGTMVKPSLGYVANVLGSMETFVNLSLTGILRAH